MARWQGIPILVVAFASLLVAAWSENPARAQEPPSLCTAIAENLPNAVYASLTPTAVAAGEVRITYHAHSTYLIESPGGVLIATDYAGFAGERTPRVVTMNRAHGTHYTDFPDPEIEVVLRGWDPEGGEARHHLTVDDVLIRNVTTDIIRGGFRDPGANSIFIFEVAGLCIGHLGHLHHELTDDHYAEIGRLDVVMVPIDGGLTLSARGMTEIIERLRASVVLPMHAVGWTTPAEFVAMLGDSVAHEFMTGRSLTLSLRSLPERPTIMVPWGL